MQEHFGPKISKSVFGPNFWLSGIFQGLGINFEFSNPKKAHPCMHVVWAIMCKNPPTGLTCKLAIKKDKKNFLKFPLYFSPLPRSPQWTDLDEILHRRSSHGCNHLFQILCRFVQGFRNCERSNFAILHWLSWSPLIQGCATMHLGFKKEISVFKTLHFLITAW